MATPVFTCPKCHQSYRNKKRFDKHLEDCNVNIFDEVMSDRGSIEPGFVRPSDRERPSDRATASDRERPSDRQPERQVERPSDRDRQVERPSERSRSSIASSVSSRAPTENRIIAAYNEDRGDKYKRIAVELKSSNSRLQQECATSEQRLKTLQQQIRALQENNSQMTREYEEYKSNILNGCDQIKRELQFVTAEKNDIVRKLNETYTALSEAKSRYSYEVNQRESDLRAKEQRITELQNAHDELNKRYFHVQTELLSAQSRSNEDLSIREKQYFIELQKSKENYEQKLNHMEIEHRRNVIILQKEYDLQKQDLERDLQTKLKELELLRYTDREHTQKIQEIHEEYRKRILETEEKHQTELNTLTATHKLEKTVTEHDCNRRIQEIKSVCEEKLRAAQSEIEYFRSRIVRSATLEKETDEKLHTNFERVEYLEGMVQDLSSLIERINSSNDTYLSQSQYYDHNYHDAVKKLKYAEKLNEEYRERIRQMEIQQKIQLEQMATKYEHTLNEREYTIVSLQRSCTENQAIVTKQSDSHDIEVRELNNKYEEILAKYSETKNAFDDLQLNYNSLFVQIPKLKSDIHEYRSLNEKLLEKQTKLEEVMMYERKEMEKLKMEHVKLSFTNEATRRLYMKHIEASKAKEKELTDAKNDEIRLLERKVSDLSHIDSLYTETKQRLHQTMVTIELTTKDYTNRIALLQQKCDNKVSEITKESNLQRDEIQRLEKQIEILKEEYEYRLLQANTANNRGTEIKELKEKVVVRDLLLQEKANTIKELQTELGRATSTVQNTMASLKEREDMLHRKERELSEVKPVQSAAFLSVRKSRDEQLAKVREANLKVRSLHQELEKTKEELERVRTLYENEMKRNEKLFREFAKPADRSEPEDSPPDVCEHSKIG